MSCVDIYIFYCRKFIFFTAGNLSNTKKISLSLREKTNDKATKNSEIVNKTPIRRLSVVLRMARERSNASGYKILFCYNIY